MKLQEKILHKKEGLYRYVYTRVISLCLYKGYIAMFIQGLYAKGYIAKGLYAKGYIAMFIQGLYAKGLYAKGLYAKGLYAKGLCRKRVYGIMFQYLKLELLHNIQSSSQKHGYSKSSHNDWHL
jgi:hypothetical protein